MKDVYLIKKNGHRFLTWTWPDDFDIDKWLKEFEPLMEENNIAEVEVVEAPPWRFKRSLLREIAETYYGNS
jgi:hypothetical protein